MSSAQGSRKFSVAASLFAGAFLALAGCTTTETTTKPPVSVSTGEPRAPVEYPVPGTLPDGSRVVEGDEQALSDLLDALGADSKGFTPTFMRGREITRVGVLLPFSHPNAAVRREAEGLLAGAELALFERGDTSILLIPKDTRGTLNGAEEAVEEALKDGANILVGPLFSDNVKVVNDRARRDDVPVIAFSNDPKVAGNGAYLLAIGPEVEVERVVEYAIQRGVESFAFLGPSSSYGQRAEQALRLEVARRGGRVIGSEFYSPSNEAPVDEARRLASLLKPEVKARPNRVAVLIPEKGLKLLAVAPLLPYYDVDVRKVMLMGTGQWNDSTVWREPTLQNGVFAAPSPEDVERYSGTYARVYRSSPSDLSSLGYDATALAIDLEQNAALDRRSIEDRNGFRGVNGAFRFDLNGTVERSLAVIQITPEGAIIVSPAPERFDRPTN